MTILRPRYKTKNRLKPDKGVNKFLSEMSDKIGRAILQNIFSWRLNERAVNTAVKALLLAADGDKRRWTS